MKKVIFNLAVTITLLGHYSNLAQNVSIEVNNRLQNTTAQLIKNFELISEERRAQLNEIGDFLLSQRSDTSVFNTLFVCTHNSRRSHITDVWFKFGAVYFGLSQFESYSGGVETTAFHPNAIAALERAGFTITYNKKVKNPAVSITPGNFPVWHMKSKEYSHQVNPRTNFVAIMVCSEADKSCPVVKGALGRFALPYEDPRYFDNTPSQDLKYDETVALIGREMLYLTSYLKSREILTLESSK